MSNLQTDSLQAASDSLAVVRRLEAAHLKEPEAVVFHFETIGWKVLAVAAIVALAVLAYLLIRHHHRNAYRRKALAQLQGLREVEKSVQAIFLVLKMTAIQAFGRREVGSIAGRDWLVFLDRTGKDVDFMKQEKAVLEALYKEEALSKADQDRLKQSAIKWVKSHGRKL